MKLLIADDDSVSRIALREIVGQPEGLEVIEVEDGQAALDMLCDGLRPDLTIIDLRMPKLDGMQLLQRIRRDPDLKRLKVAITSVTRDRDTIVSLAKLQISGYLLKPYDAAKTREVLKPLLTPAEVPRK
jgi:two-component system, chemotaxis family, chemotaxis protein CheY